MGRRVRSSGSRERRRSAVLCLRALGAKTVRTVRSWWWVVGVAEEASDPPPAAATSVAGRGAVCSFDIAPSAALFGAGALGSASVVEQNGYPLGRFPRERRPAVRECGVAALLGAGPLRARPHRRFAVAPRSARPVRSKVGSSARSVPAGRTLWRSGADAPPCLSEGV